MGMMTLDVRLSGRGRDGAHEGRIVGFSNRLNTILVPQAFMDWAYATLGDGGETAPSRLIVEVDNPADDRIARYFKQKGYEQRKATSWMREKDDVVPEDGGRHRAHGGPDYQSCCRFTC